jgi:hypothetical protein
MDSRQMIADQLREAERHVALGAPQGRIRKRPRFADDVPGTAPAASLVGKKTAGPNPDTRRPFLAFRLPEQRVAAVREHEGTPASDSFAKIKRLVALVVAGGRRRRR